MSKSNVMATTQPEDQSTTQAEDQITTTTQAEDQTTTTTPEDQTKTITPEDQTTTQGEDQATQDKEQPTTAQQVQQTTATTTTQQEDTTTAQQNNHGTSFPLLLEKLANMAAFEATLMDKLDQLENRLELVVESIHGIRGERSNTDTTAGDCDCEIPRLSLQYLRHIGTGTFASVDLCRLRHKDVAVKTMKEEFVRALGFEYEIQRLTNLHHKNLVRVVGFTEGLWPPRIVMEYVAGGSLKTHLISKKEKLLQRSKKLLSYCCQVADGMSYLESRGIVHRSLATRNIMLNENKGCQVGDFGLTSLVPRGKGCDPIRWIPPEHFRDSQYTSQTDVWAFGVIMWEVFTCGEIPYKGMSNTEVTDYVDNKKQILGCPARCPEQVYTVMKQSCWCYNPIDRRNFSDILEQLKTVQENITDDGAYADP